VDPVAYFLKKIQLLIATGHLISEFQMCLFAGMIVTSALIIWKGLMVVTGSESPVVVVLSGSMEPGFKRVCYLLEQLDNKL
jgi:hypothetical protein